jgi:predicted metalloprotease with PDZ domain
VVKALNDVEPYDWAEFLKVRVKDVAPKPPLDGITRGGWKLTYTEKPTDFFRAIETANKQTNLTYSLGVVLNREGEVVTVLWDSPAFNAGLTVSSKIMAVDGIAYDADRLKTAIAAAKDGRPIQLLVKNGDHFQTLPITYRGGLRYPRLERIPGTPDLLSEIYKAK